MVEFGLVRVKHEGTEIERSAHLVLANAVGEKDEEIVPAEEDPLEQIMRMTPDQQDKALTLAPTRR